MILEQILELTTVLVLAATLPISLIAVRGFRGAPFGAVLRPLPVVVIAYVAMNVPKVMDIDPPATYYLVTSTIAVVGALVSAAHTIMLLTERRKL